MSDFKSPFFMGLYFYLPSAMNTSKNMSHISYIGTRPGVDLGNNTGDLLDESYMNPDSESNGTPSNDDVQEEDLAYRDISGYANYEMKLRGEVVPEIELGTASAHIKYAHERPRSHGLFSSEEVSDVRTVQNDLSQHKGIVWRTIISLNEVDAIRLGYDSRKAWENMLKASVPMMANEMGIDESNLKWVAAFHEEKGHPHVHLVLWEKEPKRKLGQLLPSERVAVRKTFVSEIYGSERLRLAQEKTVNRDLLRDLAKEDLIKAVDLAREVREVQKDVDLELVASGSARASRIAPKLFDDGSRELAGHISELADIMPKKGRLAYKYMPNDVKEKVDQISNWVLRQPAQKETLDKYMNAVDMMTRPYSFQENHIDEAKEKAYGDIRKRISQVVIKAASESQKNNFVHIDEEKAKIAIQEFSNAMGSPANQTVSVIRQGFQHLRLLGISEEQQKNIFNVWKNESDLNLNAIEANQLIESVYKQPMITDDLNLKSVSYLLKFGGWSETQIQDILQSKVGLESNDAYSYAKSTKDIRSSNDVFLPKKEWDRFSKNVGIHSEYPWEPKNVITSDTKAKEDFIDSIKNASFKPTMTDKEKGWTAFCMTAALKQLDVSDSERVSIMTEFSERNKISNLDEILNKVENEKINSLKEPTWDKLLKDLGIKTDYPWSTQLKDNLDPDELLKIVDTISNAQPKDMSEEEAVWTAKYFYDLLKTAHTDPYNIEVTLKYWVEKVNSIDLNQVLKSSNPEKRTDDVDLLKQHFGIKDKVLEVVTNLSKVLFATGLPIQDVTKMILDWNDRSNANINPKKLEKIIASAEKFCTEMTSWGRIPVVGKKEFTSLNKTLGTKAPWMWKGDREYRDFEKSSSSNISQSVWKSIWRGLEQERSKTEAKGKILRNQLIRESVRRNEQSEEQER